MLQRNLSDIRGVKNIVDDVMIHGKNRKLHDDALQNCLKRLSELNLKANELKCQVLQKEIKFYGLIFSGTGTRPDPNRVKNLINATSS